MNTLGVGVGVRLMGTPIGLKLALLAVVIAGGFARPPDRGITSRRSSRSGCRRRRSRPGLAGAFVSAFFSFGGWWEVTKVAGEVRDGARTLPCAGRGPHAGDGRVRATSVAFLHAIPLDSMRTGDAFAAQLGELLFGPAGRRHARGDRHRLGARHAVGVHDA